MVSDREALLERGPSSGGPDYGAAAFKDAGSHDVRLTVESQRTKIRAQDAALEELSGGVGDVKNVARLVHQEVVEQVRALDRLVSDVETADQDTRNAAHRAATAERNPHSFYNFCLLLWPIVLVIILFFAGIRRWLFY